MAAGLTVSTSKEGSYRHGALRTALFRLMFGLKRLGASGADGGWQSCLCRVGGPAEADREACALGCWSVAHGLALLFLGGLADKAASDE